MRKPSGIDERAEQIRPSVQRGTGNTPTERYLAKLAEASFLDLWSYPTPYRDQRIGGSGDGKELCDLLVVCGEHVLIFSEKNVAWPNGEDKVAWCRWAKKAIRDSARQAAGAERWILEYPQRIFLDSKCTVPFPIAFPKIEAAKVHRIVVARGAMEACKVGSPHGSGSLVIDPGIKGNQHWPVDTSQARPFLIGDIDPEGSFVHVLDDVTLDILLQELDTIQDFTSYLTRKEEFIRSGRLVAAHGEENLLAHFLMLTDGNGDHCFSVADDDSKFVIDGGIHDYWTSHPQYAAKKEIDKVSYVWDLLISAFTRHMLGGTSITLKNYDFDLQRSEVGIRFMALENRLSRRALGSAVLDALRAGRDRDFFFRMMMSPSPSSGADTAFFIMTFKYHDWMDERGGYEHYRLKRAERSMVYARGILEMYPEIKRVVGISREPPEQDRGVSEDLVYAEQSNWTEEERNEIRDDCKRLGVLQGDMQQRWIRNDEYPPLDFSGVPDEVSESQETGKRKKRRTRVRTHRSA
jgi:hypothetical protein